VPGLSARAELIVTENSSNACETAVRHQLTNAEFVPATRRSSAKKENEEMMYGS
jgi:hypothetical protein